MISKSIVSLNHNVHTGALNNITALVIYINNSHRCMAYIIGIKEFTTIYGMVH